MTSIIPVFNIKYSDENVFNSCLGLKLTFLLDVDTNLILFDVYKSDNKIKQNLEALAVTVLTFEMLVTARKCNRIPIFR